MPGGWNMTDPQEDPFEAEVEEADKEPVPGLGDPEDDGGAVCMPTEPVGE